MSSAILYAAIVAIWAGVLVPRWLKQRSAMPRPAEPVLAPDDVPVPGEADAAPDGIAEQSETVAGADISAGPPAWADEPDSGTAERDAAAEARPSPAGAPEASPSRATVAAAFARPIGGDQAAPASTGRAVPASADRAAWVPTGRRASTIRARRRMLAALVLITVVAAALTVLHLAPRWAMVPPVLMLAGFLVVLRDAAHTDADRAFRRALTAQPQARPAPTVEHGMARSRTRAVPSETLLQPAAAASVPPPERSDDAAETGAQVIDISRRLGDQLYDQYADAADRAVGD